IDLKRFAAILTGLVVLAAQIVRLPKVREKIWRGRIGRDGPFHLGKRFVIAALDLHKDPEPLMCGAVVGLEANGVFEIALGLSPPPSVKGLVESARRVCLGEVRVKLQGTPNQPFSLI